MSENHSTCPVRKTDDGKMDDVWASGSSKVHVSVKRYPENVILDFDFIVMAKDWIGCDLVW